MAAAMVLDPKPSLPQPPPTRPVPESDASFSADPDEDLYSRLKTLQRQLEFFEIQEEYVKDELKNLRRELLRAQEEVKRIQSVPLVIGQFMEMIDQNNAIVGSTTGSNYYVRILSTINRELLKPSGSVALHRHSNALVDVLPPEADSSISLLSQSEKPDVTYNDIGGCDIQKQEIREAVELPLTHHELYQQIGIDPPRGVLLYGPPGTGKTMLAKAVANHTTASFIRVVGSEFVQKYLGEGPRMVRDVFRLAKENAPAIIFIDEVDAIATARFDAQTGADREVQRILMELLNQMDGFDQTVNVKVIMATNRADTLDPALLRPGRLDRKIEFPLPDRRQKRLVFQCVAENGPCLQVCTAKMNLSDEVDLEDYVSRPDKISLQSYLPRSRYACSKKESLCYTPKDFEKGYRSNVKKPDTDFEFYK
ncbi:UNVERIFIED_CONTAM: 26S proteasome regulatory subunitB [Sesamum angustifolium]|uniref:26S proteasome regulatory subunitB n=1 Tax=Sesamum angustifolium TaxID=2727405 RepID=A0AAW2QSF5_9LAMI